MTIDVRIFHNQIITDLNEWAVGDHLLIDVVGAMIRIQHYHCASAAHGVAHLSDYRRIDARPSDIADTGMLWPKGLDRDIDRDDATMPDLVKNHRQIESTSAEPSASLDHNIRSSAD